jgi:hypothetical protein
VSGRDVVFLHAQNDVSRIPPTRFCTIPKGPRAMKRTSAEPSDSSATVSRTRAFKPALPFEPLHTLLSNCRASGGALLASALRAQADRAATSTRPWSAEERAVCLVLADLAGLNWRFVVSREVIYLTPRSLSEADPIDAKAMVRDSLREMRRKQLADPKVREFISSMHAPRFFGSTVTSIDDLIDNGADLAAALRAHRLGSVSEVVRPYLQLADSGERCRLTGLNLGDVWRYFRFTWSHVYKPTPGRTINFLIRNAARPKHPVIAIIGLANAVFQLSTRDAWIGWTMPVLCERLVNTPALWPRFREAAVRCLVDAREAIRRDDLIRAVGTSGNDLDFSNKLRRIAEEQVEARKKQLRAVHAGSLEVDGARAVLRLPSGEPDWRAASETTLFKKKRAEVLAEILVAEHHLARSGTTAKWLRSALTLTEDGAPYRWKDADIRDAVAVALREIKKNGVATRLLDVNVCGATPVYREILGGKLAAMSLFAREIRTEYDRSYRDKASEIASSMAGRAVTRGTDLCVLTTTSLYGVGSSQYNRVRYPYDTPVLEWRKIGASEGFGTLHMSPETVEALREVAVRKAGLRNVNNRFGEGTSPLMRQLREGLTALGFEANDVLRHGHNRLVYAAELYEAGRDDLLLNRASRAARPPMADIAAEWTRRWLTMRVQNDEVLERTAAVNADVVRADLGVSEVPIQRVIPLR